MSYPRIFCSSEIDHPFARIVRWATNDPWSHAGIRANLSWTFEARGGGDWQYKWRAEYQSPDHPSMKTIQWSFIGIPQDELEGALVWLRREWEGKRYGFGQLLAIAYRVARMKCGLPPGKLGVRRLAVCSELVWRLIMRIGGRIATLLRSMYPDPDLFTPGDLKRFGLAAEDAGFLRREG